MIANLTKETTAHCYYLREMDMTNQLTSLYHSLSPNIRLFLMMKWNLIYHMMIYFLFKILYRLIVNSFAILLITQ